MNSAELGSIILIVLTCLLQIGALCLAGYLAAWREVLTPSCRRGITQVNLVLFTPALLFGKVAFTLTPSILASLWIIPVGFIALTAVSAMIAWALGAIFNLKAGYLALSVAGSMFMNSNTLPLALMDAFSNSLGELKKEATDTADQMLSKALTVLAICRCLGAVMRWSFGTYILNSAKSQTVSFHSTLEKKHYVKDRNTSARTLVGSQSLPKGIKPLNFDQVQQRTSGYQSSDHIPSAPPTALLSPVDFSSQPMLQAQSQLLDFNLENCESAKNESLKKPRSKLKQFLSRLRRIKNPQGTSGSLLSSLADFFNPPLLGSVLAIIVSCIPPLQKKLAATPLIVNFLDTTGDVAIPLTLVNLGALFYHSRSKFHNSTSHRDESAQEILQRSRNELRTRFVTIISRQILAPVVLLPIFFFLAYKTQLEAARDRVFLTTSVLVICSPPAITLAQMTSKVGNRHFEVMVSDILFWSHAIVTPFVTMAAIVVTVVIIQTTP